jgi:flagellin FlaB
VLGAGFFTTQKSQEVVHTGVQQASSTLEIVGNVYGTGTVGLIKYVNFTIALAPGGTPVDVSKMTLTFSNQSYAETLTKSTLSSVAISQWAVNEVRGGNSDDLLEKGEQMDIGAWPKFGLYKNDNFNLEVKPVIGAALDIKRTAPASIQPVNILY